MMIRYATASGVQFLLDNETHLLHELDGTPIRPPADPFPDYEGFARQTYGRRDKSDKPYALRILLGHACNFNCGYCMQKEMGGSDERPRHPQLNSLIDTLQALDLSELTIIELWGGEPFLYWANIMALATALDAPGRVFKITTNGSPLRKKHVQFFLGLQGALELCISHDAMAQTQARGREILDDPAVVATLKMLDGDTTINYGFSCTLTQANYDLFAINDYFRERCLTLGLERATLGFSVGKSYQEQGGCGAATDATSHVISGEALPQFRAILHRFLAGHHEMLTRRWVDGQPACYTELLKDRPFLLSDLYEVECYYSARTIARQLACGVRIRETSHCGADMRNILSFDLDGFARTCPHAGPHHKAGHVSTLKGIRILKIDTSRAKASCHTCPVERLCRSGCPIALPDTVFALNCGVDKVWYGEIQLAALQLVFGEPVECLGCQAP